MTRAFRKIDTNGNGQISTDELERASRVLGYNPSRKEVEEMIASVDDDGERINCVSACVCKKIRVILPKVRVPGYSETDTHALTLRTWFCMK